MQQVMPGLYTVVNGEKVTIRVEAHKVAEELAVVHAKGNTTETLQPIANTHVKYQFTISSAQGAETADIGCHFSQADPDDAFFAFFVQGDKGGGEFTDTTVEKPDDPEIMLTFTVQGGQ